MQSSRSNIPPILINDSIHQTATFYEAVKRFEAADLIMRTHKQALFAHHSMLKPVPPTTLTDRLKAAETIYNLHLNAFSPATRWLDTQPMWKATIESQKAIIKPTALRP